MRKILICAAMIATIAPVGAGTIVEPNSDSMRATMWAPPPPVSIEYTPGGANDPHRVGPIVTNPRFVAPGTTYAPGATPASSDPCDPKSSWHGIAVCEQRERVATAAAAGPPTIYDHFNSPEVKARIARDQRNEKIFGRVLVGFWFLCCGLVAWLGLRWMSIGGEIALALGLVAVVGSGAGAAAVAFALLTM